MNHTFHDKIKKIVEKNSSSLFQEKDSKTVTIAVIEGLTLSLDEPSDIDEFSSKLRRCLTWFDGFAFISPTRYRPCRVFPSLQTFSFPSFTSFFPNIYVQLWHLKQSKEKLLSLEASERNDPLADKFVYLNELFYSLELILNREIMENIQCLEEQIPKLLEGTLSFQELLGISDNILNQWVNQGHFYYRKGRYTEAEVIFKGLHAMDPQNSLLNSALGVVWAAQEKYDEALVVLNKALELNSSDLCAMVTIGEILLRKGAIFDAAALFSEVEKISIENEKRQRELGEPVYTEDAVFRAAGISLLLLESIRELRLAF